MKNLYLCLALIMILSLGCSLPYVKIEYGEASYTRWGEQELADLSVKTSDGLEMQVGSLANTEAEQFNQSLGRLFDAIASSLEIIAQNQGAPLP